MYIDLHVKYRLFLYDFKETWISGQFFEKNVEIYNFIKIRPMGEEMFHADGRSDMTKLTVAIRNFANAPKTGKDRKGGSRLFDTMQYTLNGNEWEIRCM